MALATSALIWLKALLASLGVFHNSTRHIFCDSQATLHITKNPVFDERTKHIELDCHFIQEMFKTGALTFSDISSTQRSTDIFTKALRKKQFTFLQGKLGMVEPYVPS